MAHITKFKMTAMPQMFAHINRDRGTISKYSNADIDASRTAQNQTILAGGMEVLQKRVNAVSHTNRRDLVVCCGVVVTLPEELKGKNAFLQQDFFKCCHAFLEKRFGKENAVYSVVHMDETTPHLHYGFVPVIEKERKYRSKEKAGQTYRQERICVHGVLTKQMLMKFHDELQAHVSRYFPDVRIVSDKAHRMKKNKSIAELKEASIRHMEQKEKQIDHAAFDAEIWRKVAEDNGKTSNAVRDRAYQEAEEIKQNARRIGREEAAKIKKEAYQDAEEIKRKAKPELYEQFKSDIQALEQENAKLRDETQRLHLLLEKAKKGLSKLWGLFLKKKLFLKVPSESVHEVMPTIDDCEKNGLIEKQEAKQEAQEQKPKARVWDDVKKQGMTR